jgi:hypothetical protein
VQSLNTSLTVFKQYVNNVTPDDAHIYFCQVVFVDVIHAVNIAKYFHESNLPDLHPMASTDP